TKDLEERVELALSAQVQEILAHHPFRELVTQGPTQEVLVERPQALFNSWYELFPRSTGGRDEDGNPIHGTFHTTAQALERVGQWVLTPCTFRQSIPLVKSTARAKTIR